MTVAPEIEPATVDEIESVPGLKTALQIIGHANLAAQEKGRCVIEFEKTESSGMNIQDITEHVDVLEEGLDAEPE